MKTEPRHRAVVIPTPWPGVHGTQLESARHFSRHWHSSHGIGLLERGAQRSASGCGEVDAFEGDVIATNPGEVHDGQPLRAPTRRWRMLYFEAGMLPGDPLIRPVARDMELSGDLRRVFARIDQWQRQPSDGAREAARLGCDEVLVACSERFERRPSPEALPVAMQRVRQRLADDPGHAPTLTELATLPGCSRFQVVRHFERAYGMTPYAWLLACRADAARQAIACGTPLVEAAAVSGFADQSHMTRVFVRHLGYTPGAWKKALQ